MAAKILQVRRVEELKRLKNMKKQVDQSATVVRSTCCIDPRLARRGNQAPTSADSGGYRKRGQQSKTGLRCAS